MLIQQKMNQAMTTTQRIDQRMVMANTILQMSSIELQAKIEQELLENPALELAEQHYCPRCQAFLVDGSCPQCSSTTWLESGSGLPFAWLDVKYGSQFSDGADLDDDRDDDPVARIQAETSLEDYLRAPLRAILTSEDIPIGEYLVGCLNEDGYLECELDEVALHFQVSESRVLPVLTALQSLDPPGVGARNLQECLMIQIRQLDEEGHDTHFAYEVVEKCWRELVLHSYDKIARRLKLDDEQVQDALEFIRKDLNPYPGRKFSRNWGASQDSSQMIRPDVIIRRGRDGFEVEVVESDRLLLKISDDYKRMLQDYNKHRSPESEEVRTHVAQYLSRAQLLIRSISQRRKTLQAITQCIIECQTEFFENGSIEYLKPLTRAEIAVRVSMHESTVSRATAGKFAQLPTGETVSFDGFFNGSLRVKELIRQYISQENPSHPLTDLEIASLLQQQESIQVARRTVLKYREQMKILSSNQRRGSRMTPDNPER